MSDVAAAADEDAPPRGAKVLVAVLLVLLLVPGLVGFDAWPLTGWRLFSLSRRATQTTWVIQAVEPGRAPRAVSLEDLPLAYRHAEWPMADLPGASGARRDDVCRALLGGVARVDPDVRGLVIARDHARLAHTGGRWVTIHDVEPFHTCGTAP
jgi:hypothetical protein